LTIGVVVAASGSKKVTEFDYCLSQFVGLVPRDEYRLVIHHSVAGDMRRALRNGGRSYETSWSLQSLTTSTVVAASGFDQVTEFVYLSSRIVHDSVAGGMCFRYGDGPAALYATKDNFTCSLRQATVHEP
jgi:hypothetical protein